MADGRSKIVVHRYRCRLEHLLALAAHRGQLHRQYGVTDDSTPTYLVIELGLVGRVDPALLHIAAHAYYTGEVVQRWRAFRRDLREELDCDADLVV